VSLSVALPFACGGLVCKGIGGFQSRPSLFLSAHLSAMWFFFHAPIRQRFAAWSRTALGVRCAFRIRTLLRPSPVLSMGLHTSLGRRRVFLLPAYFPPPAFLLPPASLCLHGAWSSDHTKLWRAQDSASDQGAARNIPDLARNRRRLGLPPKPSAEPTARELPLPWSLDKLS
jgi:hypothetical protein